MNAWNVFQYSFDALCRAGLFVLFADCMMPRKRHGVACIASILVAALPLALGYILNTPVALNELIRPAVLFLLTIFLYETQYGYGVYVVFVYLIISGIWGILVSPLTVLTLHIQSAWLSAIFNSDRFFLINLFRGLTVLCLRRIMPEKDITGPKLSLSELVMILIPAVVNHCLLIVIYTLIQNSEEGSYLRLHVPLVFLFAVAIAVSSIVLTVSSRRYFRMNALQQRIRENTALMEQEQVVYLQNQRNNEIVRETYHDLRNHFDTIRSLPDMLAVRQYVDELMTSIQPAAQYFHSGNMIVDILLNRKYEECSEKGIQLFSTLVVPPEAPLNQTDICSLLGNALDNAILATAEMTGDGDRIIYVKGGEINDYLTIRISNPLDGTLLLNSEGMPIGHRNRTDGHGIGVYSMKAVIDRLNGQIVYQQEAQTVNLTMLIPMK